jgi:hypothetical protein
MLKIISYVDAIPVRIGKSLIPLEQIPVG